MANTSKTKIKIPNGTTGQEFQVDIKSVSMNISVQSDEQLVSNPGKKDEKVLPLNPYANTAIQINVPLLAPEDLEKALAEHPVLAPVLALIEQKMNEKFN